MAKTPCGLIHESPVRHLPHAPKQKACKTKFRDRGSSRHRFEPKPRAPAVANPSHVLSAGTNDGQNDSPFRSHFHADDT
jgi:hypothetical protein